MWKAIAAPERSAIGKHAKMRKITITSWQWSFGQDSMEQSTDTSMMNRTSSGLVVQLRRDKQLCLSFRPRRLLLPPLICLDTRQPEK